MAAQRPMPSGRTFGQLMQKPARSARMATPTQKPLKQSSPRATAASIGRKFGKY